MNSASLSRGPGTKVLKRTTSGLDIFISLERSRRALQDGAIRFAIGQSIFEQKALQKKLLKDVVLNVACTNELRNSASTMVLNRYELERLLRNS